MIYKSAKENDTIICVDNDGFLDEKDYQSLIGAFYSSDFEVARAINQSINTYMRYMIRLLFIKKI